MANCLQEMNTTKAWHANLCHLGCNPHRRLLTLTCLLSDYFKYCGRLVSAIIMSANILHRKLTSIMRGLLWMPCCQVQATWADNTVTLECPAKLFYQYIITVWRCKSSVWKKWYLSRFLLLEWVLFARSDVLNIWLIVVERLLRRGLLKCWLFLTHEKHWRVAMALGKLINLFQQMSLSRALLNYASKFKFKE